jgi:hypothetical protein
MKGKYKDNVTNIHFFLKIVLYVTENDKIMTVCRLMSIRERFFSSVLFLLNSHDNKKFEKNRFLFSYLKSNKFDKTI